jgi:fatty acid-binding protein DegV
LTGGITGTIKIEMKRVNKALAGIGKLLALKPIIAANRPEIRIKGSIKSARYCIMIDVSTTIYL